MPTDIAQPAQALRAALVLTNAYVASSSMVVNKGDSAAFKIAFTKGSLTSLEIAVEATEEDADTADGSAVWARVPLLEDGTVELSYTDELNYYITIPISGGPLCAQKLRCLVKGTGTVTSSECTITGAVGVRATR